MKNIRIRKNNEIDSDFMQRSGSEAPPLNSRNTSFELVHDEILMLQSLCRSYLGEVSDNMFEGRHFEWHLFTSVPSKFRHLKGADDLKEFLRKKLKS